MLTSARMVAFAHDSVAHSNPPHPLPRESQQGNADGVLLPPQFDDFSGKPHSSDDIGHGVVLGLR